MIQPRQHQYSPPQTHASKPPSSAVDLYHNFRIANNILMHTWCLYRGHMFRRRIWAVRSCRLASYEQARMSMLRK